MASRLLTLASDGPPRPATLGGATLGVVAAGLSAYRCATGAGGERLLQAEDELTQAGTFKSIADGEEVATPPTSPVEQEEEEEEEDGRASSPVPVQHDGNTAAATSNAAANGTAAATSNAATNGAAAGEVAELRRRLTLKLQEVQTMRRQHANALSAAAAEHSAASAVAKRWRERKQGQTTRAVLQACLHQRSQGEAVASHLAQEIANRTRSVVESAAGVTRLARIHTVLQPAQRGKAPKPLYYLYEFVVQLPPAGRANLEDSGGAAATLEDLLSRPRPAAEVAEAAVRAAIAGTDGRQVSMIVRFSHAHMKHEAMEAAGLFEGAFPAVQFPPHRALRSWKAFVTGAAEEDERAFVVKRAAELQQYFERVFRLPAVGARCDLEALARWVGDGPELVGDAQALSAWSADNRSHSAPEHAAPPPSPSGSVSASAMRQRRTNSEPAVGARIVQTFEP